MHWSVDSLGLFGFTASLQLFCGCPGTFVSQTWGVLGLEQLNRTNLLRFPHGVGFAGWTGGGQLMT